jgi:hypothetical protein
VPPGYDIAAGRTLRSMHGMLSAGILIGVFGLTAAAALYVAARIHLAGSTRGAGQIGTGQIGVGQMGSGQMGSGQISSRQDGGGRFGGGEMSGDQPDGGAERLEES